MNILADTTCFLAVVLGEPEKARIVSLTTGHRLLAPDVLPFELGNALSALAKRQILQAVEVKTAWEACQNIAVEFQATNVAASLALAARYRIYAYDAYFLECALRLHLPLLTLDRGMKHVARSLDLVILE